MPTLCLSASLAPPKVSVRSPAWSGRGRDPLVSVASCVWGVARLRGRAAWRGVADRRHVVLTFKSPSLVTPYVNPATTADILANCVPSRFRGRKSSSAEVSSDPSLSLSRARAPKSERASEQRAVCVCVGGGGGGRSERGLSHLCEGAGAAVEFRQHDDTLLAPLAVDLEGGGEERCGNMKFAKSKMHSKFNNAFRFAGRGFKVSISTGQKRGPGLTGA